MKPIVETFFRSSLHARGFRSRFVETSVGAVHALEAPGAGLLPPIVLLHGLSSSCVHYGPLLRRLRTEVQRVTAPDMPAHGFSDVPRDGARHETLREGMLEALDVLIERPSLLYGNSMGGFAAIRYALARPDRVLGLVLCSPGGAAQEAAELERLLATFRIRSHSQAVEFIDRLLARRSPIRHVLALGIKRSFARTQIRAILDSIAPEHMLTAEQVHALTVPVLLLWGREEQILPPAHLAFFRDNLPAHARIEEPERFGHSPHVDYPDVVARAILSFAKEVTSATTSAGAGS